jgi:hypothetical protein
MVRRQGKLIKNGIHPSKKLCPVNIRTASSKSDNYYSHGLLFHNIYVHIDIHIIMFSYDDKFVRLTHFAIQKTSQSHLRAAIISSNNKFLTQFSANPRLVFPIRYIPIPEYRYSGLQIPTPIPAKMCRYLPVLRTSKNGHF